MNTRDITICCFLVICFQSCLLTHSLLWYQFYHSSRFKGYKIISRDLHYNKATVKKQNQSSFRSTYPAKVSLWLGSPDIMASNTVTTLTSVKFSRLWNKWWLEKVKQKSYNRSMYVIANYMQVLHSTNACKHLRDSHKQYTAAAYIDQSYLTS